MNIPTIFVIFGATGDLTKSRLLPTLCRLWSAGRLPERFFVYAFSRREWSDEDYSRFASEVLTDAGCGKGEIRRFIKNIRYLQGQFDVQSSYLSLAKMCRAADEEWGACSNKLFYLAVPPEHYTPILKRLAASGLTAPCVGREGWTRILIEKPFGRSMEEAVSLEKLVSRLFLEEQVFRVDHYLAKRSVGNILRFRFGRGRFERFWNSRHIGSIKVSLREKEGVGKRGSFYDRLGALLDVGQNHLLELLALVAMERPPSARPEAVRKARGQVLKRLESVGSGTDLGRAQYLGYLEEDGVRGQSETETYFYLSARIRSRRWLGTKIILEAGKALEENKTQVEVVFRSKRHPHPLGRPDKIIFRLQPKAAVEVIRPRRRHLPSGRAALEDYQKIIVDAVAGDRTLFPSAEEVRASWRFIKSVIENLKNAPLLRYRPGTNLTVENLRLSTPIRS